MTYRAPVNDMLFCMKELAGLEQVAQLPGFEEAGLETAQAVLEECAKFNEGVVAPLNVDAGDSRQHHLGIELVTKNSPYGDGNVSRR